jgi:very-short-patch-repair endonuclease
VLTRLGWTILRFAAGTVLYRPAQVVPDVRSELRRRCGVIAGSVQSASY